MLNNKEINPRTRKHVTTLQTVEEAEEILKNIEVIRHLIDKEPAQAKCEICEQKNETNHMKKSTTVFV